MKLRTASIVLALSVLACRPETPQPRTEPPATPPATEPAPAPAPTLPAEDQDPGGVRAEIEPPVAIESPSPDYSRFPGGSLPGPGGRHFRLRIDESGTVTDVQVVTAGHPEVDQVVMDSLRRWRFEPAMRDGVPIAVSWQVTVNVDLR